jgi:hypothetical protein
MDLPIIKKSAAVQATTNDQVLQPTMGSLPLYLFEKLLKSILSQFLSQIMIISMLKTKIFAFKT